MKKTVQILIMMLMGFWSFSQITSSGIRGRITDTKTGEALSGATIDAIHIPSGTRYSAVTLDNGNYQINNMRVGGPYKIVYSFIGYHTKTVEGIYLALGVPSVLDIKMETVSLTLQEVNVTSTVDPVFSSGRTGAATSVDNKTLNSLPTISRRIDDFTRLTPQAGRGNSFAGVDNRLNNITVDGSYFNNSFGLAGQPGDRTGVSPISLDAIDQIQVNIAPYDVRQGLFTGATVNTVTRSGTNEFQGSIYHFFRNNNMVGRKAKGLDFTPGQFNYDQYGARLGGPIIKDKLFFFASYEYEKTTEPGTTFRANRGNEPVGGNVTRVLASDLDSLSSFLFNRFGYVTGPYEGYDNNVLANKFLIRLDYNLDKRNKLSLRYTHLNSSSDILLSNSSSLGFGNRRSNLTGLNFKNSNYKIQENIRSIIGEWNSQISNNMSNQLILGYTFQDESRVPVGQFFPMVDILKDNTVYTTFGFEPFSPNNELRYSTFQLQNNFNIYSGRHTHTMGLSLEYYQSENIFFPGSQSIYVYSSLDDFYTDALDYFNNPNRTTSPITLRRFQVRWSNIPGQDKPIQPLKVTLPGIYYQDNIQISSKFNVIAGIRVEAPIFGNTGYKNPEVDTLKFRDEKGNIVSYSTDKLPDPRPLISPRLGFNLAIDDERTLQIRGGSGVFSGRPAYVWISNQIGNNGILTGFERRDNTNIRPFNPNPNAYKPSNVSGAPASQYELALTDPNFAFPQVWRSNIAVDYKLPLGMIATLEGIYNQDVNGIYYINANLAPADSFYTGIDPRPRWTSTAATRIYNKIDNAIVLKNQNVGYSYNISATIERPAQQDGIYFKLGYSYGIARNTVDPGSIAFGSWINNPHTADPNNPGLGFSVNTQGHRAFGALSYNIMSERTYRNMGNKFFSNFGNTTISFFYDGFTQGVGSYTYSGDMNGDGGTSNDLIYIPKDKSEMNFEQYSVTINNQTITFTVDQQKEAWDNFINRDPYLSKNRGKYAERNGAWLPMVHRVDFSIAQEIGIKSGNRKNSLQFRVDILNFTNFLNSDWGVGRRFTSTQPLINRGRDANGQHRYRLLNLQGVLIQDPYQFTNLVQDVWRIQVGIRYNFN
ncbi:MAG: carboxypeptidase regulatory-like domain-containing protein [Thermaurantimonas sp.]